METGLTRTVSRHRQALLLAAAIAALAALAGLFVLAEQRRAGNDRLEVAGGGFLYNYRIGEIRYDLVVAIVRPMPIGTRIEVEFENPAGGPPILLSRTPGTDVRRVGFESAPLAGVKVDTPYRVVVRLHGHDTGAVLESHERMFRTSVDPALVPDAPLTVGPGYHRNPAAAR